ncbi:PREDICTED: restriction of telomere capping protein 5-like [Amphimedon queenslandica]|uniref:TLDc domain-containing protein n=1 Tax=Amphimedon queenslandica TaxID=400682 RepID=A0A1X7VH71_AMPQE|nr:PREDICTED: restriction of telomere capping protein 5-like [Amphimedon queenslandica]|eukprot:XP_011410302.1 PREDICTED: restriction of telomere capping protein 5-like [Amphimedon queenslandica]
MGQSSSSPLAAAKTPRPSNAEKRYASLYEELNTAEGDGKKAEPDVIFKTRFSNYFGGPCVKFGQYLHDRLFKDVGFVDKETFVKQMKTLSTLLAGDCRLHEAEKYFFYVFSHGEEKLDQKSLAEVIHTAAMFALVVGSDLHERAKVPRDHPIISSLVSASMLMTDSATHELTAAQFAVWMTEHCPRLLEGLQHWTETLLHGDHTDDDNSMHTQYQLPCPKIEEGMEEADLHLLVWALSTIIPLAYLGHRSQESSLQSSNKHPVGGTWMLLYSSSRDGLSFTRFMSLSSDYRDPSILLLTCRDRAVDEVRQFVIGVDKEWRDGSHYWGEDNCFLLELEPSFTLLKKGAKLVSLNEKQRGFPTGIRFMSDTSYKEPLLVIDSSLNTATYKGNITLDIQKVEVWGCGGKEAAESQRRLREWEKKERQRRQKIHREDLKEMWEESPDRYILEMGGVKVNNPKEQQQQ